jgi:hypothetical protein
LKKSAVTYSTCKVLFQGLSYGTEENHEIFNDGNGFRAEIIRSELPTLISKFLITRHIHQDGCRRLQFLTPDYSDHISKTGLLISCKLLIFNINRVENGYA